MLKILHVDPAGTWRGGERQVFFLARELIRRGHDAKILAPEDSALAGRAREASLPVIPLSIRGDLDFPAIFRLAGILRREAPNVLHLHTARAHAAGGIAARLSGFHPVVVTRRLELPVRGLFSRLKYRLLGDHWIAISAEVEKSLLRAGVPAKRIDRIPSGVELPERATVPSTRDDHAAMVSPGKRWVVGTLAAFTPQKDPATWIEVARRICRMRDDVEFVWWGEGELRPGLQEIVRRENLTTRIDLPGFREDLGAFWAKVDVFFLPSRFEALGTVLLDSMARGVPVVASQVGGIPEIVRHEVEGLLVAPGSVEGFEQALGKMLDDVEGRRRAGRLGIERAGAFEISGIVSRILEVYERQLPGAAAK